MLEQLAIVIQELHAIVTAELVVTVTEELVVSVTEEQLVLVTQEPHVIVLVDRHAHVMVVAHVTVIIIQIAYVTQDLAHVIVYQGLTISALAERIIVALAERIISVPQEPHAVVMPELEPVIALVDAQEMKLIHSSREE